MEEKKLDKYYEILKVLRDNDISSEIYLESKNNYENVILPVKQLELAEYLSDHLETEIFKRSVEAVVRAENICKKYPQKIAKKIKEVDLLLPEEKSFYKIFTTKGF